MPGFDQHPVEWVRRNLGFEPDRKQALVLSPNIKNGILNCTRQWGKSTIAAAKAIHLAATVPDSLIIIVSPSARQSGELLHKCSRFAAHMGMPARGDGLNEISLKLPNQSRIIALPGSEKTIRGFSAVDLLLVDEASRVDDGLYQAVRPMLAVSNGAIWLMSTPFGKQGFFWEAWERSAAAWERICVPATECSRISNEFLEQERLALGSHVFDQEYMCCFTESGAGLFSLDLLESCLSDDVAPWTLRL